MCTTTEVPRPRDIDELLGLDTYQDMTDAEIDVIIEYKVNQEIVARELAANMVSVNQMREQVIADGQSAAQRLYDVVQSIVERDLPDLVPFEPQQFTPTIIS